MRWPPQLAFVAACATTAVSAWCPQGTPHALRVDVLNASVPLKEVRSPCQAHPGGDQRVLYRADERALRGRLSPRAALRRRCSSCDARTARPPRPDTRSSVKLTAVWQMEVTDGSEASNRAQCSRPMRSKQRLVTLLTHRTARQSRRQHCEPCVLQQRSGSTAGERIGRSLQREAL